MSIVSIYKKDLWDAILSEAQSVLLINHKHAQIVLHCKSWIMLKDNVKSNLLYIMYINMRREKKHIEIRLQVTESVHLKRSRKWKKLAVVACKVSAKNIFSPKTCPQCENIETLNLHKTF